jgi:hypothetical protein
LALLQSGPQSSECSCSATRTTTWSNWAFGGNAVGGRPNRPSPQVCKWLGRHRCGGDFSNLARGSALETLRTGSRTRPRRPTGNSLGRLTSTRMRVRRPHQTTRGCTGRSLLGCGGGIGRCDGPFDLDPPGWPGESHVRVGAGVANPGQETWPRLRALHATSRLRRPPDEDGANWGPLGPPDELVEVPLSMQERESMRSPEASSHHDEYVTQLDCRRMGRVVPRVLRLPPAFAKRSEFFWTCRLLADPGERSPVRRLLPPPANDDAKVPAFATGHGSQHARGALLPN